MRKGGLEVTETVILMHKNEANYGDRNRHFRSARGGDGSGDEVTIIGTLMCEGGIG